MRRLFERTIQWLSLRCGFTIIPERATDYSPETAEIIWRVRGHTMTSPSRIAALCDAVAYVVQQQIPGDIVECGVWRGGSMMAAALTLKRLQAGTRHLRLYDTFEGMSEPADRDRDPSGRSAAEILSVSSKADSVFWAYCPLEEVQRAIASTGYDPQLCHFIKGPVEQTLPAQASEQIALLRLDTDWYRSTYHELTHLYPRLSVGGVLLLDDYGYWQGAREAVDQYIAENRLRLFLHRIDHSGRLAIKIDPTPSPAAKAD